MNATPRSIPAVHRDFPVDGRGNAVDPEPHFDRWDPTPHAYFMLGVTQVRLSDVVLGGTHQVDGIGRADQRGAPAVRLDLTYVAASSEQPSARVILPTDQTIEVKRYTSPSLPHRWSYVRLNDESVDLSHARPGLVPDYGADTARCGCGTPDQPGFASDGLNADGYDYSSTMCDECAGSWALDHEVVRG